jgi:hypothetical protein
MIALSAEQKAIVDAPLAPLAVVACAGSGKTHTAVHRLLEIRRRLGDGRGRVALLSFSNVAVKTFRDTYHPLAQTLPQGAARHRVEIDTLDGFITTNLLRPHAPRTMGCNRTPFLILGTEPFLQNKDFQFWAQPATGAAFPVPRSDIGDVIANFRAGAAQFEYRKHKALVPINNGPTVVARLGKIGGYTHSLGQYWALRTLQCQPLILAALARRYPHILIDESQDIGTLHQAILTQLAAAGSQISLIGDPHQGIYDFAGADGDYLARYHHQAGVLAYPLTRNFRSVPSIVTLANALSGRNDTADRAAPGLPNGGYFIGYKKTERDKVIVAFQAAVISAGLSLARSAILCRGRAMADSVAGTDVPMGQGLVKLFALAAVLRDRRQDYLAAFKAVAGCVVGLLKNPPEGLLASISQPARFPEARPLRREIWKFARDPDAGLPGTSLLADTQWHPLLTTRVKALLQRLQKEFGLVPADHLGNKLAKTELPHAPLMSVPDLATEPQEVLRVDTVHKVKGEGLDALLYLVEKGHAEALLSGVDTELGRIGYVAMTRARNLAWVGVPANALSVLRPVLIGRGFVEVGAT